MLKTYLASVEMKGDLGALKSDILVAVKEFFMRDFNGRDGSNVTYSSKDGAYEYYKGKFKKEAENLGKLNNPSIIKVVEHFEANQTSYYVMELVAGGTLDEYISTKKRLTPEETIQYGIEIAEALQYMHENEMLHLDLKPNNIMIKESKDIVIIDFGLAKRFDAYGKPETSTTIGHGTPGYAPIEQANYQGTKDGVFPATLDIYAFGATLYKMLTGHRAPEASIILNDGFPFVELEEIGTPSALIRIVRTCMEPLKKNRYQTAEAVLKELRSISLDKTSEDWSRDDDKFEETTHLHKGYYKRKIWNKQTCMYEIERIPVDSSIPFPQSITVKLWNNDRKGMSYELFMSDCENCAVLLDGCETIYEKSPSEIKIWKDGELLDTHNFSPGIPEDVRNFIIEHGLLSTEHWENEISTIPGGCNYGIETSIIMENVDGSEFIRYVGNASDDYHNLLLNELRAMLKVPSIAKIIDQKSRRVKVKSDTKTIKINYTRQFRGIDVIGYVIELSKTKISVKNSIHDVKGKLRQPVVRTMRDSSVFDDLLNKISKLEYNKDGLKYSESSEVNEELSIVLYASSLPYLVLNSSDGVSSVVGNICGTPSAILKLLVGENLVLQGLLKKSAETFIDEEAKQGKDTSENDEKHDYIFSSILATIAVGILALPVWIFANRNNIFTFWLWVAIAFMELCGGVLFPMKKESRSVLGFICALIGAIAYLVLWILYFVI